ncbi:MAG: hypothetical protein IJV20_05815 [Prevotella sp.]|nr:hypothetical protein [Prevotella sp.]
MKKEIICRYILSLIIVISCAVFCSCEDDFESVKYPIEGEWFYDESGVGQISRTTIQFSNDGLFKRQDTEVGISSNSIISSEGIYSYKEKLDIVYTTSYDQRHHHAVWRVVNADNYSLTIYDESQSRQYVYCRVVDTYTMTIGESKQCNVDDGMFKTVRYHSCDENIANVDDSGMITAVKRGTTYIKCISDIGEVVIRIVVSDPHRVMDDYVQYVGLPVDSMIAGFNLDFIKGKDSYNNWIIYHLHDDVVRSISARYIVEEHITDILGEFQQHTDINKIVSYFDSKYIKDVSNDSFHSYFAENEDYRVLISIDEKERSFVFSLIQLPTLKYDGMVMLKIDDFADYFKYDLTANSKNREDKGEGIMELDIPFENSDDIQRMTAQYNSKTREIIYITYDCFYNDEGKEAQYYIQTHYYKHKHPTLGSIWATSDIFPRAKYYIQMVTSGGKTKLNISYFRTDMYE